MPYAILDHETDMVVSISDEPKYEEKFRESVAAAAYDGGHGVVWVHDILPDYYKPCYVVAVDGEAKQC